jgi:hypothetical protein
MPETPDFKQIAHLIVDVAYTDDGQTARDVKAALEARASRRSSASCGTRAALPTSSRSKPRLTVLMGAPVAGPLIKNLDRALRQLDR